MAKKKPPAKKPAKPAAKPKRDVESLLVAESAGQITAHDCAAYGVLMFNRGETGDEAWQKSGVEALAKFANFGWTIFHAIGGLNVEWDAAKFPKLPRKAKVKE
jgi:hypothetical protein